MPSKNALLEAAQIASSLAKNPQAPVTKAEAPALAKELTPYVEHLTNNEPWYQSRVTWGAFVSIVLPLLGAFGVVTDRIDADTLIAVLMALGSAVGGAITLYGRWKAKKPIGA